MAELDLPALRLWQLSQQALSGMIAGLLKQPRTRVKGAAMAAIDPENDPKLLKRRIAQLEKEVAILNSVNEILKLLPSNREKLAEREAVAKRPKSKSRTPAAPSRVHAKQSRERAQEPTPIQTAG
ncbi:MAG: hypothetical protein U1E76_07795 [Planctomycetota bacterium]